MERLINATCPDCRGPLTEAQDGITEFKCLVGHRYSPLFLVQAHAETEERALWTAVVALEEWTNIARAAGPHLPAEIRGQLEERVTERMRFASQIRGMLEQLKPLQVG